MALHVTHRIKRTLLAVVVGQLGFISLAFNYVDVVLSRKVSDVGIVQGENRGIMYLQCLELEARRLMIMQSVAP